MFTLRAMSGHDNLGNVVAPHCENARRSGHEKRSWHIDMGRLRCRHVTYGYGFLSCLVSFLEKRHEDL